MFQNTSFVLKLVINQKVNTVTEITKF